MLIPLHSSCCLSAYLFILPHPPIYSSELITIDVSQLSVLVGVDMGDVDMGDVDMGDVIIIIIIIIIIITILTKVIVFSFILYLSLYKDVVITM